LDGIHFDDRDFFQEQQEEDRCWKLPLNLAVVLHVVIFAASIFLPDLIERRPLLDDIVTVDLISMPEPVAAPPAPLQPVAKPTELKAPVKAPEPVPEPEVAEVSVAPELEVAPEPAAPAKPSSLKPLKRRQKIPGLPRKRNWNNGQKSYNRKHWPKKKRKRPENGQKN